MHRALKFLLYAVLAFVLLIVLAVVLLMTFNWNRAKPWINERVSDSLGRPFAIQGDLSVDWQRAQSDGSGWRRWIPWPQVRAQDIVLANADWARDAGNMVQVRQVNVLLNPFPLLNKTVSLPRLDVSGPEILLMREKDGRNNWTFKQSDPNQESAWKFQLDRLNLQNVVVRLEDETTKAKVRATLDTLDEPSPQKYGIGWKVDGEFNGAPVKGSGKAGAVLSLQDRKTPYPVEAELNVGDTNISIDGTLTDPGNLAGVDMALKVSGASMSLLYPLTGLNLPQTPKFSTEGRVIGAFRPEGADWTYERFQGSVGKSDLSGSISYLSREPRPLLKGELVSKMLRLEDLAPLIGADSPENQKKRQATSKQPANRVLPVEPFNSERWDKLDVDVTFTGKQFMRGKELPLDDLVIRMKMQEGDLMLAPLNFGVAGGNIISNLHLDGRGDKVKADMTVAIKRLKLKKMFPEVQSMKSALGEVNGQASLKSTGNSPAALAAGADGDIRLLVSEGTVSKFILEAIGLNVGNLVLTQLFGDRQVQMNCLAADLNVKNGVVDPRTFVVDTKEALLDIDGTIHLGKEAMDLTIRPETKGLRLFSLRSPIYVEGTFKNPDVGVDKTSVALKAGAAIALGAISPIAALLPLINPGEENSSECGRLISSIKKKTETAEKSESKKKKN